MCNLCFNHLLFRKGICNLLKTFHTQLLTSTNIAFQHLLPMSLICIPVTFASAIALLFEQVDLAITAMKGEGMVLFKPCMPVFSYQCLGMRSCVFLSDEVIICLFRRPTDDVLSTLWH